MCCKRAKILIKIYLDLLRKDNFPAGVLSHRHPVYEEIFIALFTRNTSPFFLHSCFVLLNAIS